MADANDVVYSYEADTSGIMESIDSMMEGIDELIESIDELVSASASLGEFEGIFEEISTIFSEVDASASDATTSMEGLTEEVGAAADQISGLTDTVSMLSDAMAEDTALIDSLNETIVSLQAQVDMLTASETGAEVETGTLAEVMGTLGAAAIAVGDTLTAAQGPMMMLGVAGVMAGKSFLDMGAQAEDSLNQVQALAGVGASDMAKYTSQLEDQATQFGESLDQEAQGLFYVTSAGFQNADAMEVLGQAVEDAKAGHIDLAVSARALDASLNAYGASAAQATQYNDYMVTAVTKGSQTFGDFAAAISKAAIAGHSANISFNQVAAAESELTNVGMTARQASMDLSTMMKAMDSNADQTAATAEKMGLKFNEASYKTMDLFHQMTYLQDITKGNQTELTKLVGGSAGIAAFNGLMTQNRDGTYKFAQSLDAMKDSTGAAAQAFATSQDTISSHMAKVQASLSVISYKALEALAPTINAVADAVGRAADFMSQHMDIVLPALAGLATFFGVVVVAAIGAFIISFGTAGAIIAGVAAGIGAAVGIIIAVITHWGQISSWLQGAWSGVTGFFSGLWQNLRGGVSDVGNWFKDRWKDATTDAVGSFDWLYSHNYYFKSLTDTVKTATTNAGNFLKGAWKTASTDTVSAWNDLKDKATDLWEGISTPFKNAWGQYIAPPLNTLWTNVKGLWGTFVTDAENLGKNLIQGVASGIRSKAGEAGQAAQNIGDRIASLLGFHNIAGVVEKNGGTIVASVRTMGNNMVAAAQQGGANLLSWWNNLATSFTNSPLGGTIVKTLQGSFSQVGQQFGQIGNQLKTNLGGAISGIMPSLNNLGGSFKLIWNDLEPIGKMLGGAFLGAWKSLSDAFSQIDKVMAGSFMQGWHQLQDAFGAIGKALAQIPWGTLLNAMEQVGSELDQVFLVAWKAIQPALAPIGQAFSQIGKMMGGEFLNVLKIVGVVIGGVLLLAISAILGAIVGLAKGLATFIGGIAKIIGGIVQIFSGIIQIISGIIAFIVDLCTGHFNKLGADLGVIWNGIKTMFTGVWNVIQGLFQATVGTLVAIISGFVGTIVTFFISLGNSMGLHVSGMINGVVNWFQQLPGRAMAFVHNLVSGITTTLGGLGAKALTWAGDMINQFIQGIENGIAGVGNAVSKVADKIKSFLHFSKPDTGPLVDVDNWMPDFMNLLSKGIDDNINKVKTSALGIATAINTSAPSASNLPSGPNAGTTMGNEQMMYYLQQIAQNSQRQQVSPPTSANLGAITQHFGNLNFNGVQDPQAFAQIIEKLQGQEVIYGQRGALFNN